MLTRVQKTGLLYPSQLSSQACRAEGSFHYIKVNNVQCNSVLQASIH
jgi:hypothetical protein